MSHIEITIAYNNYKNASEQYKSYIEKTSLTIKKYISDKMGCAINNVVIENEKLIIAFHHAKVNSFIYNGVEFHLDKEYDEDTFIIKHNLDNKIHSYKGFEAVKYYELFAKFADLIINDQVFNKTIINMFSEISQFSNTVYKKRRLYNEEIEKYKRNIKDNYIDNITVKNSEYYVVCNDVSYWDNSLELIKIEKICNKIIKVKMFKIQAQYIINADYQDTIKYVDSIYKENVNMKFGEFNSLKLCIIKLDENNIDLIKDFLFTSIKNNYSAYKNTPYDYSEDKELILNKDINYYYEKRFIPFGATEINDYVFNRLKNILN